MFDNQITGTTDVCRHAHGHRLILNDLRRQPQSDEQVIYFQNVALPRNHTRYLIGAELTSQPDGGCVHACSDAHSRIQPRQPTRLRYRPTQTSAVTFHFLVSISDYGL